MQIKTEQKIKFVKSVNWQWRTSRFGIKRTYIEFTLFQQASAKTITNTTPLRLIELNSDIGYAKKSERD
jgi:hypothetical protein